MRVFFRLYILNLLLAISISVSASAPDDFQASVSGNSVLFTWSAVSATDDVDGQQEPFYKYTLRHWAPENEGRSVFISFSGDRLVTNYTLNDLSEGEHKFQLIAVYTDNPDNDSTRRYSPLLTVDVALPPVTFSISNDTVEEGGTLIFTVTKSRTSLETHSVSYATADSSADSSDYIGESGTLVFSGSETSKIIDIVTIQDAISEYTEMLLLNLHSPTNGALLADSQGYGLIVSDDPPLPPRTDGFRTHAPPATSVTGNFDVQPHWDNERVNAANWPTRVEIERQRDGGIWELVGSGSWPQEGYTYYHTETGVLSGSYIYRARACNNAGCGGWDNSRVVVVDAPLLTPDLNVDGNESIGADTNGDFEVNWLTVPGATYYQYQRRVNSGVWLTSTTTTAAITESNLSDGTYEYRVVACDDTSCYDYSPVLLILVENLNYELPEPIPSRQPFSAQVSTIVSAGELAATTTVGRTQGEFSVSKTGAAAYSIPLFTVRGTGGHTPQLSLEYSSQSGSGVAGIGWSIGGLSNITRCRSSLHQDKYTFPLSWSINDNFCLDGQRLIAQHDGTYRPEIDKFTRITLHGNRSEPDYFVVERQDGSISWYGVAGEGASERHARTSTTIIADAVLTWGLTRLEDPAGNSILFDYDNTVDDFRIKNVRYGFGGDQSPQGWSYSYDFYYQVRPDPITQYIGGYEFRNNGRLTAVRLSDQSGSELREYLLRYNEGVPGVDSKVSRLTSIQECVDSTCLAATRFDWQLPQQEYDSNAKVLNLSPGTSFVQKLIPGDFNGDGKMDLAWLANTGQLKYALSNGSELVEARYFSGASHLSLPTNSNHPISPLNVQVVDYNADGRSDLAVYWNLWTQWRVYLSKSNGQGEWLLSNNYIEVAIADANQGEPGYEQLGTAFEDIDGDGLTDGIYIGGVPSNHEVKTYPLVKDPLQPSGSTKPFKFAEKEFTPILLDMGSESYVDNYQVDFHAKWASGKADFNGDGVLDRIMYDDPNLYSCPIGFDGKFYALFSTSPSGGFQPCAIGANYVPYTKEYVGSNELYHSTAEPGIYYKPYGIYDLKEEFWKSTKFKLVDLNKDGLTDIVYLADVWTAGDDGSLGHPGLGEGGLYLWGGANWYYVLSTGEGFTQQKLLVTNPDPVSGYGTDIRNDQIIRHDPAANLVDVNGDGYLDFIWFNFDNVGLADNGKLKVKYWDPGKNEFTGETDFCPQGTASCEITYSYLDYGDDLGYSESRIPHNYFWDVNGDGRKDYIYYFEDVVKINFALETAQSANKIISITDGLGRNTRVHYDKLSRTSHYAKSDIDAIRDCHDIASCWHEESAVASEADFYSSLLQPFSGLNHSLGSLSHVMEIAGSLDVVTKTELNTPSASPSAPGLIDQSALFVKSYYYAKAKLQASGRGFLGFESIKVVHENTGIESTSRYRQDWPFLGRLASKEVRTAQGNLLSRIENTWSLYGWQSTWPDSAVGNGTVSLGIMKPYLSRSVSESYALDSDGAAQGLLLSRKTKTIDAVDQYLNTLQSTQSVEDAAAAQLTIQTTNYEYGSTSWEQERALISRMTITDTRDTQSFTRTSAFSYYTSGALKGLLKTETLEPDDSRYTLVTTYTHDAFGNVTQLVTTDSTANTRKSSRSVYDSKGRYVEQSYEEFSDVFGNPQEQLAAVTLDRDRYGNPSTVQAMIDGNNDLRSERSFTVFGVPYFESSSTGSYSATILDSGEGGVCQSGTVFNALTRAAGGGESYECLDIAGRTIRTASKGFDGTWIYIDTEYDVLGHVLRRSEPYSGSSPVWTEFRYDILGRVTNTTHPKFGNSTTVYDAYNTTVTNALNQQRTETVNALGEVVQVKDDNSFTIDYFYDANGNLRRTEDRAGVLTTITYDRRGRKTSMSEPSSGSWSYTYNAFGDLLTTTDALGQVIENQYDFKGRLKRRIDRTGSGAVTANAFWAYDTANSGWGQLHTAEDTVSGFLRTSVYDSFGRPSLTITRMAGHNDQIETHYTGVAYDEYGRLFQTFDAARDSANWDINGVEHHYNAYGYLARLSDAIYVNGTPQSTYYTIQAMDSRGNVTQADFGGGVVSISSSYDADSGLVEWQRATSMATELQGYVQHRIYDWDAAGNLNWRRALGLVRHGNDTLSSRDLTETFGYDNLNRLTTYTVSGDASHGVAMTYADNGNISTKSDVGAYSYNAGRPHAVASVGGTSYHYDDTGQLTTDGTGRTFSYTTFRKVKQTARGSRITSFDYGPDRQRYRRVDSSNEGKVTTLYIGSVEKLHYQDGTREWKRNIGGVALVTQKFDATGQPAANNTHFLLRDHLGSLTHILDEMGDIEENLDFDPWGRRRAYQDWRTLTESLQGGFYKVAKPVTSRGFTEHEMVDEMDFIHMNGRIYDPRIARFLQVDPMVQAPDNGQSYNRYSYAWNNPTNATDPSGFQCVGSGGRYWVGPGTGNCDGGFAGGSIPDMFDVTSNDLIDMNLWIESIFESHDSPAALSNRAKVGVTYIDECGQGPCLSGSRGDKLSSSRTSGGSGGFTGFLERNMFGGITDNGVNDVVAGAVSEIPNILEANLFGGITDSRYDFVIALGVGAATEIAISRISGLLYGRAASNNVLNIGAGDNPLAGAVNIDLRATQGVNVVADAAKLPFRSASFSEINAVNPFGFKPVSAEVARVIQPGGFLRVTGTTRNQFAQPVSASQARAAGFEIIRTGPIQPIHQFGVQRTNTGGVLNTSTSTTTVYRRLP